MIRNSPRKSSVKGSSRRGRRGRPPKGPHGADLSELLSAGGSPVPNNSYWTENRYEQVKHFKLWTYIGVDRIARRVASQLPNVSWIRTTATEKTLPVGARQKALLPLLSHEQLEQVPHNHPLLSLLRDPNEPDVAFSYEYETVMNLYLTGSAYWWVPSNSLNLPAAIWVLPSHWMHPVRGQDRLIDAFDMRPTDSFYAHKRIPMEDLVVFRFPSPISKIDGYSPLTAGALWADVLDSINRARLSSYKNGTFPTISLEFDPKLLDPDEDELKRIDSRFAARYRGEYRANMPLYLPPGVRAKPISLKPNEMVFGETAEETRDALLALLGVPLAVAGVSRGQTYGANVADQAAFHSITVNPLCKFLGQVKTEKLAWRYDRNLRIWYEDMTPDDPEMIEKRIQTDLLSGAITVNEQRALRGREPYPWDWANEPVIPVNMAPLSNVMGGSHSPSPGLHPDQPAPSTDRKHLLNGFSRH